MHEAIFKNVKVLRGILFKERDRKIIICEKILSNNYLLDQYKCFFTIF